MTKSSKKTSQGNLTKKYKKSDEGTLNQINTELKASDLSVNDRMETVARKQAFISMLKMKIVKRTLRAIPSDLSHDQAEFIQQCLESKWFQWTMRH